MDIYSSLDKFTSVSDKTHNKWLGLLKSGKILYLHGMFGYGKTSQGLYFAKSHFKDWYHFTANDSDFFEKAENFIKNFKKTTGKTLLILDDIHNISSKANQNRLFELLLLHNQYGGKLQLMLLSHVLLPEYLIPLRITQQLVVIDRSVLVFSKEQIIKIMRSYESLENLSSSKINKYADDCLNITRGSGLFIQIYISRLSDNPNDPNTAATLAFSDTCYHLDASIFSKWTSSERDALTKLGVFPSFTTDMAKLLLGHNAKEVLGNLIHKDSFLKFTAPDSYTFHPIVAAYFSEKLNTSSYEIRSEVYKIAASYYEKNRDFKEALRCYKLANRTDKITEIVIYLLENADGCIFAKLSAEYIDNISPQEEAENPSITGAKAMLYAYRMLPDESKHYLSKLRELTINSENKEISSTALSVYVRTLIASPCSSSNEMKENLLLCSKYVQKYGIVLENIMPSSNSSSIISGGIDLLFWAPQRNILYLIMKKAVTVALGVEGVGAPDAALGEFLYEQNDKIKAIASLTQALSDANFKGSIRIQYAITGIMARLLESDGEIHSASEILTNIYEKAKQQNFIELLPNITTNLVHCALLKQDVEFYQDWLDNEAPNEYDTFYITDRYQLLAKAYVYTTLGKYIQALHIIDHLDTYCTLYHREYMSIQLLILKSIILYRNGDDFKTPLITAVKKAKPYDLIRVFADEGIALLPLWKEVNWEEETSLPRRYINTISKELGHMANYYPKYLQTQLPLASLTDRELEVLILMAEGVNNTQIAEKLNVNIGTAKFHVSNVIKKLKTENRTVAVKIAKDHGLVK